MKASVWMAAVGGAVVLGALPAAARVGVEDVPSTGNPGRLEAPEGQPATGATAGFDLEQGGFFVRSADGQNRLSVGGRLDARFDAIQWDDSRDRDDTLTFSLSQLRLYFLGNVFGEENTFYLQLAADGSDAYDQHGSEDGRELKLFDGWLKHRFTDGFALKGGQFKVPFSRQWLSSTGRLQLPDRALASRRLVNDPRDIGFEASGGFRENVVQYAVAVVNGDGPNQLNGDDRLGVYGRLSWSPTGDYGYSEGDLEGSEEWATTIGVAGHYQEGTPGGGDQTITRFNVDGGLKRGGASLQGEFYRQEIDPREGDSQAIESYYVQGGYFVKPGRIEIAARASQVLYPGDQDDAAEYSAGLSFYQHGHRLKWQAAYSYYDDELNRAVDHRLVGQVQLWF